MDLVALYTGTKLVHVICVVLSGSLFAARGLWVMVTQRVLWTWLRVLPHLIDTLLLASGLTLAFLIQQYPFVNSGWLTAKVVALLVYIALGTVVFRGGYARVGQAVSGLAAVLVFAYIVSVAINKQPGGFFAIWS